MNPQLHAKTNTSNTRINVLDRAAASATSSLFEVSLVVIVGNRFVGAHGRREVPRRRKEGHGCGAPRGAQGLGRLLARREPPSCARAPAWRSEGVAVVGRARRAGFRGVRSCCGPRRAAAAPERGRHGARSTPGDTKDRVHISHRRERRTGGSASHRGSASGGGRLVDDPSLRWKEVCNSSRSRSEGRRIGSRRARRGRRSQDEAVERPWEPGHDFGFDTHTSLRIIGAPMRRRPHQPRRRPDSEGAGQRVHLRVARGDKAAPSRAR